MLKTLTIGEVEACLTAAFIKPNDAEFHSSYTRLLIGRETLG